MQINICKFVNNSTGDDDYPKILQYLMPKKDSMKIPPAIPFKRNLFWTGLFFFLMFFFVSLKNNNFCLISFSLQNWVCTYKFLENVLFLSQFFFWKVNDHKLFKVNWLQKYLLKMYKKSIIFFFFLKWRLW